MRNANKTSPAPATTAGRPRDRRIDDAILAATRELLVSQGYSALSLTTIAGQAGTSTPALYRRWPTKAHLVHEAAFPADAQEALASSGDLAADVRLLVAGGAALFSDPVVRAALPGLIADLAQHPSLHEQLMARLWGSQIDALQEILDNAAADALARPGLQARDLLSLIGGSALLTVVSPGTGTLDVAWIESITGILLDGIAR